MNLEELKAKGGLVPQKPIPRAVTWTHTVDGEEMTETFTIHVKRRSFGDVERAFLIDPKNEDMSRSAQFIADSIFLGEDGTEPLTYEIAYQLEPSLAKVFMAEIREVNEMGQKAPKN